MKSRLPASVMAAIVCAASLVARAAPAAESPEAPASADVPSAAPPAVEERPASRYAAEVGGGQTRPSPTTSSTSFLHQRAAGHYSPTPSLELGATFRANEDFASPHTQDSTFSSGGDAVFYGAIDGTYLLSPHFDLTLGINGSPVLQPRRRDERASLQGRRRADFRRARPDSIEQRGRGGHGWL
jgi:hypothetical protein